MKNEFISPQNFLSKIIIALILSILLLFSGPKVYATINPSSDPPGLRCSQVTCNCGTLQTTNLCSNTVPIVTPLSGNESSSFEDMCKSICGPLDKDKRQNTRCTMPPYTCTGH